MEPVDDAEAMDGELSLRESIPSKERSLLRLYGDGDMAGELAAACILNFLTCGCSPMAARGANCHLPAPPDIRLTILEDLIKCSEK
jgi:hypothetical protein